LFEDLGVVVREFVADPAVTEEVVEDVVLEGGEVVEMEEDVIVEEALEEVDVGPELEVFLLVEIVADAVFDTCPMMVIIEG
jgi:hypothetical protein